MYVANGIAALSTDIYDEIPRLLVPNIRIIIRVTYIIQTFIQRSGKKIVHSLNIIANVQRDRKVATVESAGNSDG